MCDISHINSIHVCYIHVPSFTTKIYQNVGKYTIITWILRQWVYVPLHFLLEFCIFHAWHEEKNWRLRREQSNEDALGRKRLWEARAPCIRKWANIETKIKYSQEPHELHWISTMLGSYRRSKLKTAQTIPHCVTWMEEFSIRMTLIQDEQVSNSRVLFLREIARLCLLWTAGKFIWGICDWQTSLPLVGLARICRMEQGECWDVWLCGLEHLGRKLVRDGPTFALNS